MFKELLLETAKGYKKGDTMANCYFYVKNGFKDEGFLTRNPMFFEVEGKKNIDKILKTKDFDIIEVCGDIGRFYILLDEKPDAEKASKLIEDFKNKYKISSKDFISFRQLLSVGKDSIDSLKSALKS